MALFLQPNCNKRLIVAVWFQYLRETTFISNANWLILWKWQITYEGRILQWWKPSPPGNFWISLTPINIQSIYLISLSVSFHCAKHTYWPPHTILIPWGSGILKINWVAYVQGCSLHHLHQVYSRTSSEKFYGFVFHKS